MLGKSVFSINVAENEIALSWALKSIYEKANGILSGHPLYRYFEAYLGGYLLIMEPDGTLITAEDDDTLTLQQRIGYVHPLDRDRYYQSALVKAQSLLNNDFERSFDALSEEAGAIKLKSGLIISYSGFEFLELKDQSNCDNYEDIFETINLYTLLTSDFFNPKPQAGLNPYRYIFADTTNPAYNALREEILFSLSYTELIDIATKISTTGLQYNFSLLNEVFIAKVLLETGFIDMNFVENVIKISNARFSAK
ncbi:hypothetical protein KKI24_03080 [bacterium]|nr:hypothetical protein [bacterium]